MCAIKKRVIGESKLFDEMLDSLASWTTSDELGYGFQRLHQLSSPKSARSLKLPWFLYSVKLLILAHHA